MIVGNLEEEMAATPSAVFPGVGEEPSSGGMTEEVGQPMQGVQPILPSVPLVTQDPEASSPLLLKILSLSRLSVPSKLCHLNL